MQLHKYKLNGVEYINFTEFLSEYGVNETWKKTAWGSHIKGFLKEFPNDIQVLWDINRIGKKHNKFLTLNDFKKHVIGMYYFQYDEKYITYTQRGLDLSLPTINFHGREFLGVYVIYRFLDSQHNILYVGSSSSFDNRLAGHTHLPKECYSQVKKVEIFCCRNEADMYLYETYFINKYKPKYNGSNKGQGELSFELPEVEWVELRREYKWKN